MMAEDLAKAKLAMSVVGAAMGASLDKIQNGNREQLPAMARQVAMYLTYVGFGLTLARTAIVFGRDRSTVGHACRLIEDRRDDPEFDRWIASLEDAATRVPVIP
jgi:chromosomal replication initiation ATPase DnaA